MVKRFPSLVVFLLLLVAPGGGLAQAQSPVASGNAVHIVVAVQGPVAVKRRGWSDFAPALLGTLLQRGDLLRVEGSSQAKVVCASLKVADAPRGINGVACPAEAPVIRWHEAQVMVTRGSGPTSFPLVISPRNTRLLNPHPTLRWAALAGANKYVVNVRGGEVDWQAAVAGTETVYPDSAPPLKAGVPYKLIVSANGRHSNEEQGGGLGFTLLTAGEAKTVSNEEKKIRAMGLPGISTSLLLAHLYVSYGLHSDAIDLLEALPKNLKEPAPFRLLGELYRTIGVIRQAEARYLTALGLSQSANDEEGQLLAQHALGQIYLHLGNKALAAQHLNAAQELSKKFGDQITVNQITRDLAKLK